jgi:hypothetical protein
MTSGQLVAHITKLTTEANVRTIEVRPQNGDVHFEIPMSAGVVTGGIVALAAPWLVALGALACMVAKLKIEIVRQAAKWRHRQTKSDDSSRTAPMAEVTNKS